MNEIINPRDNSLIKPSLGSNDLKNQKIYKLKNSIWNKILSSTEFENFNDQEYILWLAIYKDSKDSSEELTNLNPVTIEQKMALIEVLNGRLIPTVISPNKILSKDVEKLNFYKLHRLQSLMKEFDLSSKLSREDLSEFASDLLIILKGPPISLMDYFTKDKTVRMNERMMRIVQEDILLIGLRGMMNRIPEKDSYTKLERARYLAKKFFHHKVWRFLVLPYDLPWIESVRLPDELLEKIIVDGLDAHDQELVTFLKKQNMIDHYERVRKVYKPVAFSLGFYFYYDKFNDKMDDKLTKNQEEEKNKFLEEFKNLGDAIKSANANSTKTETMLKDEQFTRVLKAFRDKYKEEPTKLEYEEMKLKIYSR